mgnify:CR=1 FL=1
MSNESTIKLNHSRVVIRIKSTKTDRQKDLLSARFESDFKRSNKDAQYANWLKKEQKEARFIEQNL